MFNEETTVNIHRQDVTRYSDRDRTLVLRECSFNISNLIRQQKLDAISSCFAGSYHGECRWIPWNYSAPLIFNIRLGVDHPCECALERLTRSCRLAEWLVSFEWRPVRNYHQRGAGATQPRYLQVSGILSDVGIRKRTLLVRFFETTTGEYVVEDHWHAERAELNGLIRFVL